MNRSYDVVVIGSGPNGLAAAVVAARCGLSTLVLEAETTIGGGTRSAELTLPGFVNDVCSAVHPMGAASPLFRELPLGEFGLEWITPPVAFAHPFDGGRAVILHNDLEETAASLGKDRKRYLRTIGFVARNWKKLEKDILAPPLGIPSHPITFSLFGLQALLPATTFGKLAFGSDDTRALFGGCAAHSILPLTVLGSAAIGVVMAAVGHVYGWPVPKGGSQSIADSLAMYLRSLGGEIITDFKVESHHQLPEAKALMFDTSPRAMAHILRGRLPASYTQSLETYPYGPGVFKLDWALSAPIPWKSPECAMAATVHVAGTMDEMALSEQAAWDGEHIDKPFVLVTQPSLFDATRAPAGKHTAWAYCHVPNGSNVDMTNRIESQIERFAPGFRDVILKRASRSPAVLEQHNANLIGGDVGGGSNELMNLFFRPNRHGYVAPVPGVYLCSAATAPGGGVHGMCGYHAATRMIKREFGKERLLEGQRRVATLRDASATRYSAPATVPELSVPGDQKGLNRKD